VNIPNILTFARILMIPLFVVVFYLPGEHIDYYAAGIFCLAGFTDWLDGFLARKLNQSSRFGAFLDPVADKLLVAVALVLLAADYGSVWIAIPASIIVSREIVISALREWMAELGKCANISVNKIGKIKTGLQMLAIVILLSQPATWDNPWVWLGIILMYLAVAFTLWSMLIYLKAAWKTVKEAQLD